jgi:hypothetical protein
VNLKPPSPRDHPATAATLSVGGIASMLCIEMKQRFNIDITLDEALLIVLGVVSVYHFLGGKVKK